ncbi:MAG: MFS transporter, partial [Betaproteobacteria bacterium]
MTTAAAERGALVWRVFIGFGCAYFMSYAFRVVNSIVGADLARELGFSGGDLGLLTSVYLLSFGLMQLPLGVWLDRYPAAAVNCVLLMAAGTGAMVFAGSNTLSGLLLGRVLIGIGVSACLMSAFRAFASWFSVEQQARLNMWMLVMGSSGALAVTAPAEALLPTIGWRGLFVLMGALAFGSAAFLWVRAPRGQPALDRAAWRTQFTAFARIFGTLDYWRLAPASFVVHGGFMAMQGLWIALWWVNVNG